MGRNFITMDENINNPTNNQTNDAAAVTPPTTPPVEADNMQERLERLGGEPAPVITPEEFARLQKAGQVHIDERGRVKTARRIGADAGVSLRKRRAWYGETERNHDR